MPTAAGIIDRVAWTAILNRDRRHDGKFVYAALTTGIYCRPSCPARHPRIRNTQIFTTPAQAERQGFVPCLRCHPKRNSPTTAESAVEAALEWIDAHIHQPIPLSVLSQVAGLSPNHLHRVFKRMTGLSPKQFTDARRADHFRRYVRQGMSINIAAYSAGYGSSRALYERAAHILGMTPATYAKGARGIKIRYATFKTPLGHALIAATGQGICAVLVGHDARLLTAQFRREFPHASVSLEPCDRWNATVKPCLEEDHYLSQMPLHLRRRIFQARASAMSTRRPIGAPG